MLVFPGSVASSKHIEELRHYCPILEELTLLMPRTGGDEQEVALYRALGTFPWLKRISLIFDCSKFNVCRMLENFHLNTPENVRIALIKAAVDSSLASSIFSTIDNAGLCHDPTSHSRLECLTLKVRTDYPESMIGDEVGSVTGIRRVRMIARSR
jgi:hypothetical protein